MDLSFPRVVATAFALAVGLAGAVAAAAGVALERRTLESKSPPFEVVAAWPRSGIAAVDADVKRWVDAEVAAFRRQEPPEPGSATAPWTFDLDYDVARNDADVLALLFTESTYTGGAHGSHVLRGANYLRPDGARVDLAQVLDGQRGLDRLAALAIADLERQLAGPDAPTDKEWIRRGAAADWDNYTVFLLLPDALEIHFDEYQVAAYVAGPQKVRIPLAALDGALRKDWRAPAASFDCAKAATAVEHAICADAALARLDRELAQAYGRARATATEESADRVAAVRAVQRRWLGRRGSACAGRSGAVLVDCLAGLYRARLAELAPSP